MAREGICLMTRSLAVLLTCALGVATAANAADSKAKKTEEQQIQALQQQLQAVEAQLKQLADQNRALMQHQQQIEQQLAQQAVAQQNTQPASALPDGTSAARGQAAAAAGGEAPGNTAAAANTALPGAQPGGFGAGTLDNLRLWGYGELYYSRPTPDTTRTTADLARAVFG